MRPQRPCIETDCAALHRNPGPRCGPHERAYQRARNRKRTQYQGSWKAKSKRAIEAEPWCHRILPDGTICRATTDLTLDHETGTVQCRACNSGHQGTTVPSKKGYATTLDPEALGRETR